MKHDDQKISVLRDVQWRIEDYFRANGELPNSLPIIFEPQRVPTPPDNTMTYSYAIIDESRYELCAEFNQPSITQENSIPRPVYEKKYNWDFEAGEWCFERNVSKDSGKKSLLQPYSRQNENL